MRWVAEATDFVLRRGFLKTQSKRVVRECEEKLELLSSSLWLMVFGSETSRCKWKLLVSQLWVLLCISVKGLLLIWPACWSFSVCMYWFDSFSWLMVCMSATVQITFGVFDFPVIRLTLCLFLQLGTCHQTVCLFWDFGNYLGVAYESLL